MMRGQRTRAALISIASNAALIVLKRRERPGSVDPPGALSCS